MLRGERVGLRARHESDVPVLHAELQEDVATRSRSDTRAWRPVAVAHSPYSVAEPSDDVAQFSVEELATGELAGVAALWGIDHHNRLAHLGLSLRPDFRGRGLGADVVRVLTRYGFATRGLHRLQLETLADNDGMVGAALGAGYTLDGTLRGAAWVTGRFHDEVVYGLLAEDWHDG